MVEMDGKPQGIRMGEPPAIEGEPYLKYQKNPKVMKQVQRILDRRLRYRLPKWRKEGSREEWITYLSLIRDWNWSCITGAIAKRDKYICQDCKIDSIEHNTGLDVHHIIPRSKGGSDHPHNLKSLCPKCHRKYTKHLANFKSGYDKEQMKLCPA